MTTLKLPKPKTLNVNLAKGLRMPKHRGTPPEEHKSYIVTPPVNWGKPMPGGGMGWYDNHFPIEEQGG